MATLAGFKDGFEHDGILEMIDTEEKQLRAIEDLYSIVKAQPQFKAMKEPSWTPETSPLIVLNWLLRKLGPLAEGNSWTIDTYLDGSKNRYRFVVYRKFNGNKFHDDWYFIPLDFLPRLKKRDQPLHDLIIDVVAIIGRCNKVPFWDEDGDYSEQMDELLHGGPSGNHVLDIQQESYRTGPAAEYLRLLHRREKKVTHEEVAQQITAYNDNSQRKSALLWWLRKGLAMSRSRETIWPFEYVPNYRSGSGVGASRYYKFVWSLHENDAVHCRAHGQMRADDSFPPVMHSITCPGKKVHPVKESTYPMNLYEFMSEGYKNLVMRYRAYFYKNQLEEQQTPAEQILQHIEELEIRKRVRV